MDKKAGAEIKKLIRRTNCRLDQMRGCYVNENKEKVFELKEMFLALEDKEMDRYCEILRKTLSGRLGKNLFNTEFPLEEEAAGGKQAVLMALRDSCLKDDDLVEDFYQKVIETYDYPGKYLILLVHGMYDIPAKTSDGLALDEASEYVYSFLVCCMCPVELLNEGLCYDGSIQKFLSRSSDYGVKKPTVGFLFPSFNDRQPDIHELLYYAAKGDARHEELAASLRGCELDLAEKEQQDTFHRVIEEGLGRGCDFEMVKNITDAVNELVEAAKDDPSPVQVDKGDMVRILEDNGVDEDTINQFKAVYDENVSDSDILMAENVVDTSKIEVKSAVMKVSVKNEATGLLQTKIIDGVEYLLVPLNDDVEVNGIRIKRTQETPESVINTKGE